MIKLKCLVFDIETSPILAYVWDLKDQNISVNQIYKDQFIIAWGAKWLGEPASKTMYRDQRNAKHIENDREILTPLWHLLDEADVVITQNGQHFDSPKLNARFIAHGMKPPSSYKHLDTYQIAKHTAKFTSNKLEYLTDKLCTKYKKLSHSKFPGFSLWKECLKGNLKAWQEMERYNIHDVLSTEELYTKLQAWTPLNAPSLFIDKRMCRVCGKEGVLHSKGYNYTKISKFRKMQCTQCHSWTQGPREAL